MRLIAISLVTAALLACASQRTVITASGSAELLPMMNRAALAYERAHPNVSIRISDGGAPNAIAQVLQKNADLAYGGAVAASDPALVDHRVTRSFHLYTNGQPSAQVAEFIEFIRTQSRRYAR